MENMEKKRMNARFWTPKQCRETRKQCIDAGFTVTEHDGFTKIYNDGDLVVSWIKGNSGQPNMVRVDLSYFN